MNVNYSNVNYSNGVNYYATSKVTADEKPMAKLAINKSLLKEFSTKENDRVVYMRNGDEFQISIFNPLTTEIGVDITIDGESIGSRIVIRPGERIWLDRTTNDSRKLQFNTYDVENTEESKEAIRLNGVISLTFYKKKNQEYSHLEWPQIQWYDYSNTPSSNPGWVYLNNTINTITAEGSQLRNLRSAQPLRSHATDELCLDTSANYSTANYYSSLSSDINKLVSSGTAMTNDYATTKNSTLKTGRVGKSKENSDIEFENVSIEFETYSYRTETIRILPVEMKPIYSSDLKKRYCSNCGRKVKQNHKFCPYCGQKL